MSRPPVALVVVVALLGVGLAVGALTRPAPAGAPEAEQVPVVGALAVCPHLLNRPDGFASSVAAGVAPAPPAAAAPGGQLTGRPLGADDAVPLPVEAPGQAVAGLATDLHETPYLVRADGPLAAGMQAQQTTASAAGTDRGLATVRCEPPASEAWYAGGATTAGDATALVLVNPDDADASVDVTVWSTDGRAGGRAGRGLTVPAQGQVVVPLDRLAPARAGLALRVRATRGRVASGLRHVRFDGLVPLGAEWVPRTSGPGEVVVVPGFPAGPGGREVRVTNPGDVDAVASVEVTTADGQFVPVGLDALAVPSGSTVVADLTATLATTPAAVRVRAQRGRLLAVGVVEQSGAGVRELAYLGAVPELAGPALLPDVVVDGARDTVLLVSALTDDARVVVEPLAVAGQPPPPPRAVVAVPAGRTAAVPLPALLGGPGRFAVSVRQADASGPVHAAAVTLAAPPDGPLVTATALRSVVRQVPRPAVERDPGVVARP